MYRIFIDDLVREAAIGVHPHEHGVRQPVRFTVEVELESRRAAETDRIEDTLSYEDVVKSIDLLLAEGHVQLVETLAERLAATCLAPAEARRARVRIEKPNAIAGTTVGCEIERYGSARL